ncbi:MAG: hypothetical protein DME94_11570 [Verrucomicrobia bacterium]|nr:MAG: hypothetical protein DME94_11570 [Verrucomicrobiota bacterium]
MKEGVSVKRRRLTQTPYKQPQFSARFARRNSGDGLPSGRFSFHLSQNWKTTVSVVSDNKRLAC